MEFPVVIYAEKGDSIAHSSLSREGLEYLIDKGAVIGVGSWTKIRKLRYNELLVSEDSKRIVRAFLRLPIADDNRTITIVSRTFTHHKLRSLSYAGSTIGCAVPQP